jgi:hypothetical protein
LAKSNQNSQNSLIYSEKNKIPKNFPVSLSKNSKISPGNKNTGDIRRQTHTEERERERKKKFEIGESQEVKLRIKSAKMECFMRFSVARICQRR